MEEFIDTDYLIQIRDKNRHSEIREIAGKLVQVISHLREQEIAAHDELGIALRTEVRDAVEELRATWRDDRGVESFGDALDSLCDLVGLKDDHEPGKLTDANATRITAATGARDETLVDLLQLPAWFCRRVLEDDHRLEWAQVDPVTEDPRCYLLAGIDELQDDPFAPMRRSLDQLLSKFAHFRGITIQSPELDDVNEALNAALGEANKARL